MDTIPFVGKSLAKWLRVSAVDTDTTNALTYEVIKGLKVFVSLDEFLLA